MKKQELEFMQEKLNEIKIFSNKLDYRTSSFINKNIMPVINCLAAEEQKMNEDEIDIVSPRIQFIQSDVASISNIINDNIQNLMKEDYQILDFGIISVEALQVCGYIKYTR